MSSLNSSSIPIAAKQNVTFRKRDVRITKEASLNDTVASAVSTPFVEIMQSGSVVTDGGVVTYFPIKAFGTMMGGRNSTAAIPSKITSLPTQPAVSHNLAVPSGAIESPVIPTSIQNNKVQIGIVHTGNKLVERQSVGDTLIQRASGSGTFGEGN